MGEERASSTSGRRPLPRRFFARDTETVARELIGTVLWVDDGQGAVAGRIVEAEAYLGAGQDAASHAHRGPTPRARIMFRPAGVAYVYLIYGMHHCFNVVTGRRGEGGAVLVRALEPRVGLDRMRERRPRCGDDHRLCAGPGRLCRALGLDLRWNGQPLNRRIDFRENIFDPGRVWIAAGIAPARVVATERVGIRLARDRHLRFCDPASDGLSRPIAVGG
jgi:DNA-3-methyladenine glycosylase